jgi:hypothetical protein
VLRDGPAVVEGGPPLPPSRGEFRHWFPPRQAQEFRIGYRDTSALLNLTHTPLFWFTYGRNAITKCVSFRINSWNSDLTRPAFDEAKRLLGAIILQKEASHATGWR